MFKYPHWSQVKCKDSFILFIQSSWVLPFRILFSYFQLDHLIVKVSFLEVDQQQIIGFFLGMIFHLVLYELVIWSSLPHSQGSKDHLWYRPRWQLPLCDKPHLLTIGCWVNFSNTTATIQRGDVVVVGLLLLLLILPGFELAGRCNDNIGVLLLARFIGVEGRCLRWPKVATRQDSVGFGCQDHFISLPGHSHCPKVIPVNVVDVHNQPCHCR